MRGQDKVFLWVAALHSVLSHWRNCSGSCEKGRAQTGGHLISKGEQWWRSGSVADLLSAVAAYWCSNYITDGPWSFGQLLICSLQARPIDVHMGFKVVILGICWTIWLPTAVWDLQLFVSSCPHHSIGSWFLIRPSLVCQISCPRR